ncbi:MAG: UDP-2,3-diacylglucosamine diphosphatase [Ignavibacteria bacterium]
MAAYFISDVHLGLGSRDEEKAKENRLLAFFRAIAPSTEVLFIVGDLFDFWFEYKTVIPKGFHRTLAMLQEFTDASKPIHYLAGNHDFWMNNYFADELGMTLHFEPFEVSLQGKRIFLHHGDGLAQNDLGYRLIKPILRHPFNIQLYRWLHPDIGVRLARGSSRTSRAYTSAKDYGEEEGMLREAERHIRRGCDIVVMGHRHKPSMVPIEPGVYINLGDWITHHTYAELSNGAIALKTWQP